MTQNYNFTLIQGDSFGINLALADGNGNPQNISGSTFIGSAKIQPTDVTASFYFTCSVTIPGVINNIAPSSGSVSISIHPSSSAAIGQNIYQYAVKWIEDPNTVHTILQGTATILGSV